MVDILDISTTSLKTRGKLKPSGNPFRKGRIWKYPEKFPYSWKYIYKLALWKTNAIARKGVSTSY